MCVGHRHAILGSYHKWTNSLVLSCRYTKHTIKIEQNDSYHTSLNTRSRTAPEDPSWAWFEFLQLFEVHPWLHPHFGFINLFHTTITGFQCKMIQLTGNYLFFSFQHPLKFQKTILHQRDIKACQEFDLNYRI